MRISELNRRSGISTASIKFYTREGLLAPGRRTGYNQTDYDDTHLTRLRLIRALTGTGGLAMTATRRVLEAIDDLELPAVEVMGVAQEAATVDSPSPSAASVAQVEALIRDRDWHVGGRVGIDLAASTLDSYADIDRSDLGSAIHAYADAAELVAAADLQLATSSESRDRVAETVVVGTVLGDVLFAGLRRLAQTNLAMRLGAEATVEEGQQTP